jgi:hypothetical protein
MEQLSIHYYKQSGITAHFCTLQFEDEPERPVFPEASFMAHGNIPACYLIASVGLAATLRNISTKSLPA